MFSLSTFSLSTFCVLHSVVGRSVIGRSVVRRSVTRQSVFQRAVVLRSVFLQIVFKCLVDESFGTVQIGLWPNSKLFVSSLLPLVSDRLEVSRIWSPTTNNYRKIQLRVGGSPSNWPHNNNHLQLYHHSYILLTVPIISPSSKLIYRLTQYVHILGDFYSKFSHK